MGQKEEVIKMYLTFQDKIAILRIDDMLSSNFGDLAIFLVAQARKLKICRKAQQ